jgi:hypothetical protein
MKKLEMVAGFGTSKSEVTDHQVLCIAGNVVS